MTPSRFLVCAALLCPAALFAESFSQSRMVPPDFEEIDYGKVVYNDRMNLTVDSPCGLTSSSASGGLWRKLNLNLFRAIVTRDYRGVHRGDFNGGYTPCGSGGMGASEPPTWRGSANAGKKLIAPMIADVMFIRAPSTPGRSDAAVASCFRSFRRVNGFPAPPYIRQGIIILVEGLYVSANWEPPTSFSQESDFQSTLVSTKEYRMINKTAIRYDVTKDGKIDRSDYFGEQFVNGYTPVIPLAVRPEPSSSPLPYSYIPGDPGPSDRATDQNENSVFIRTEYSTRIGIEGYIIALVGGQIPNVWDKFIYTARANGTYEASVLGSFFPTHKIYTSRSVKLDTKEPILWRSKTSMMQQDSRVGEFIFETGWFVPIAAHPQSPVVLSGQSTTF